jgi:starch synthase
MSSRKRAQSARKTSSPTVLPSAPPPGLRLLIGCSEVHPYSKTGGLADMVSALAKTMARRGHRVGVVTPLYRGLLEKLQGLQRLDYFMRLPMGPTDWVEASVHVLEPEPGLTIYFINQPIYYDRGGLYSEAGRDYPDNAQRFFFLAKAVVHLARYLPWQPEIVHVHDWQVGIVPALIRHQAEREGWQNPPRSILSIHNLAYQGVFGPEAFPWANLPREYFTPSSLEFYGTVNCLKAAIVGSDLLTTVSPRYAREITTAEYGCGLDPLLRHRQSILSGILNGVDYEEWQTEKNPHLPAVYSARDLAGKETCKVELQKQMRLPVDPTVPLFGSVTRLADQKGVDIQLGALEEMLASGMQFVLLGSGAADLERAYRELAARYPTKVAVQIGYNHALSHRIEAAADFFLMPSLFEPCGLNQMYSLRYGTIPIVRVTGGLDDSVIDITEDPKHADGIKFHEYSSRALAKAIRKALALYQQPRLMNWYRKHAMAADFSWDRTASQYEAAYRSLKA